MVLSSDQQGQISQLSAMSVMSATVSIADKSLIVKVTVPLSSREYHHIYNVVSVPFTCQNKLQSIIPTTLLMAVTSKRDHFYVLSKEGKRDIVNCSTARIVKVNALMKVLKAKLTLTQLNVLIYSPEISGKVKMTPELRHLVEKLVRGNFVCSMRYSPLIERKCCVKKREYEPLERIIRMFRCQYNSDKINDAVLGSTIMQRRTNDSGAHIGERCIRSYLGTHGHHRRSA